MQVARRILMGTYALSAGYYDAYYKRAQQASLLCYGPVPELHNKVVPERKCTCPQEHLAQSRTSSIWRRRRQVFTGCSPRRLQGCNRRLLFLLPLQVRTLIQREMNAALQSYDALLCPAAPTPAYKLGEKTSDPLAMYKGERPGLLWEGGTVGDMAAGKLPWWHALAARRCGACAVRCANRLG